MHISRIFLFFILFLSVFFLTSCDKSSNVDWTVLVYLDGDNDLAEANIKDVTEIVSGAESDELRILLQIDLPDNTSAKRYEIIKGKKTLIDDIGEVDMSAQETLTNFLVWAKKQGAENSEHIMLVLSDHGSGWDQQTGASPANKITSRALFVDWDSQGEGKNTPVLHNHRVRQAILDAKISLDILGLDASIMGTIEAIYEFSDLADIIISSQEVGYKEGWDYDDIFTKLSTDTTISPNLFSQIVINSYRDYFENTLYVDSYTREQSYGIAAHQSNKLKAIVNEIDQLAVLWKEQLQDTNSIRLDEMTALRDVVQDIDPAVQFEVYVDLKDLLTKYDVNNNIPELIDDATLFEYHGKDRPNANGLSIVFLKPDVAWKWGTCDPNYQDWNATTGIGNKGKFINETQWDEMLSAYYGLIVPELSDFNGNHPCNALFE